MDKRIMFLGLVCSLAAAFWFWSSYANAKRAANESQATYDRSQQILKKIDALQQRNQQGVRIMGANYNSSTDQIDEALNHAKLIVDSVPRSSPKTIVATDVKSFSTGLSVAELELLQAVAFTQKLANSDANHQVVSITLEQPREKIGQKEKWTGSFEIQFLKRVPAE